MNEVRQQPARPGIWRAVLWGIAAIVIVLAVGYALSRVGRQPAPAAPTVGNYSAAPGAGANGPLGGTLRPNAGGAGGMSGNAPAGMMGQRPLSANPGPVPNAAGVKDGRAGQQIK